MTKLTRQQQAQEIYLRIKDLPIGEREQFIAGQFAEDSELRAEVENLIKDEGKPDSGKSFIGTQLGVYRITREIGRGGMGMVYLATRTDGEFRQNVAVKLIKRGMDTDFILERFRRERQITAELNHPNIAGLFNGGTTSDDLPYFVMEYISGKPLFHYARERKLNLREKLNLFLQICEAVVYAHEQRIVHRDIKPGNILVTDAGVAKLLDFGIAKILNADSVHESLLPTATAMQLMTPEYASPEQIKGEAISEAVDQYSLGVVLYELISGVRPYKFPSRAPHEIARVVCEETPPTLPVDQNDESLAEDVETNSFDSEFYRQLDRIVLKSLRKQPSERYASVKEFAADIQRLLRGENVRAESFAATAAESRPIPTGEMSRGAIAVLPFSVLKAKDADETGSAEFLSVGLADALVTRLSHVRQFLVRPTSSTLRYNDSYDLSTIGRELNVGYILSGKILSAGGRIRLSVQLLDARAQSVVWAERYDEELIDVLHIEDKISSKVAGSIVPHLAGDDRRRLEKRATDSPEAYEAYLRGRFHWTNFTEQSFSQAIFFYRKAVEIDPDYALAYAGIADYYIWLGVYGIVAPKDCYPPAKDYARRAIAIDGELAEAYASLGFAELCGDFDWTNAEENLTKAIELSPNYAIARLWYSYVLQTVGRFDEGIEQSKRAIELDSVNYTNYNVLAWAYYFARRFDEAIAQCETNVEKFSELGLAYFTQSWVLRYLKRHDEAEIASRKALDFSGGSLFILLGHAQALAAAGKKAEVEKTLKEIFAQSENQYLSFYQVALIYVYEGEKEKALESIEKAYEDEEGWLIWLAVEPALDDLRDEPRFRKLLKQIGLSVATDAHVPVFAEQTETFIAETGQTPGSENNLPAYVKFTIAGIILALLIFFIYKFIF